MPSRDEITQFLVENNIDEKASSIFVNTPSDIQDKVLSQGSFNSGPLKARNPSSALITRIRDCTNAGGVYVDQQLVESFIAMNQLDERASTALRTAAPAVQDTVLKRGDLGDVRSTSAALLGRLRDARTCVNFAAKAQGTIQPTVDIEGFVLHNNLDERAAESLRVCAPKVQQLVIARGDLQDCRNPSSVILCRIKDAHKGMHTAAGETGPVDASAVEEWMLNGNLDENAAGALRSCTPIVQRIVMNLRLPQDARNPSAIVLGRIKDAKAARAKVDANNMAGVNMGGGGGGGGGGAGAGAGGGDMNNMMTGMMGMMMGMMGNLASNMQPPAQQAPPAMPPMDMAWQAPAPQMDMYGQQAPAPQMDMYGQVPAMLQNDMALAVPALTAEQMEMAGFGVGVENFIATHRLDENAAQTLRDSSSDIQDVVMSPASGGLDVSNPSSVILARIKVAKMKQRIHGHAAGNELQQEVEKQVALQLQQEQQMQVQQQLQQQQQELYQQQLLQQQQEQQLQAQAEAQALAQASEVTPQELYQFIVMNGLDERASEALQGCPPDVQRHVMDKGDLSTSKNPSGSCMGRIRDARQAVNVAAGGGQGGGMAGGQPNLNDMMKGMMGMMGMMMGNANPGAMGAGMGAGMGGGMGAAPSGGNQGGFGGVGGGGFGASSHDRHDNRKSEPLVERRGSGNVWDGHMGSEAVAEGLEDFITGNHLDQRAATLLLASSLQVQQYVMAQGSLRDARNPSAAVGGRIRDAQKGHIEHLQQGRSSPYHTF